MTDNDKKQIMLYKGHTMRKALIISAIVILSLIVAFVLFISSFAIMYLTPTEWDTYFVTASNGKKFRVTYEMYNWPDINSRIFLHYRWDKDSIYIKGEETSKDINIDFLYENSNFSYYKVTHLTYDENTSGKTIAILSKNKKISIITDGSYIECVPEINLFVWDFIQEIYPLAKYEILSNNNGDFIIKYAESLITDEKNQIIDKMKYFVENPDEIKCEYYTKEEIISKCNELLDT